MRSNIKLLALLLPMGALLVMFQQCSGVSFKNADEQSRWSHECAENASKCEEKTEIFNSGTSNKKIDFVWVVDNSASMDEEVSIIQNNIALFADRISDYADLKMAVIAAKDSTSNPNNTYQGSPNYLTMPTMPAHIASLQVNTLVKSNDPLILGALSLCPSSGLSAESWCAKFQADKKDDSDQKVTTWYDSTQKKYYERPDYWSKVYEPATSSLSTFLRDQSHKVFVFVTDDDAYDHSWFNGSGGTTAYLNHFFIRRNNFLNAYHSRFPNALPIVYSIVGLDGSVNIARKGDEYIALSGETGGGTFDISNGNWSTYFDEMLEGIEVLARSSFPLETVNIVEILSVKIYSKNSPANKRELAVGEYTLNNRTLTIRDDVVSGYTNFEIEVKILEYVN